MDATPGGPARPASPRDSAAFDMREALEHPGCAVCRLSLRSVGRLLHSVAYEQVNDPALRDQLRAAHGFCNQHAYRWLHDTHNVLGTAIIYRDLLADALRGLNRTPAPSRPPRPGLLRALFGRADPRQAPCPACRAQLEAEQRYLEALVASVAVDQAARAALGRSQGLCRRHTLGALRIGGPGADIILQRTREVIETLLGHLDEVIRKEDYRYRHEERSQAERAAPGHAIAWVAGVQGLVDR